MNEHYKLDEMDRIILSELINDARKPYLEIARECGVSGAAIHQRVKRLEEAGLPTTDENIFISAACKDGNVDKGIEFLLGKGKVSVNKTANIIYCQNSIICNMTYIVISFLIFI